MKNSSKLMRLGSSLSHDFPCLFTHHNFAIRLRDKNKRGSLLQPNTSRLPRNTIGRPRWDDTQVNYWTRGDGRSLSFFQHELQKLLCKFCSIERRNFARSNNEILLDRTTKFCSIERRSFARSNDNRARFGECNINRTARQLIDN